MSDIKASEHIDATEFLSRKQKSVDSGEPSQKALEDLMSFMKAVEIGDYPAADAVLERLVESSDGELYKELGKITRSLHDSLRSFRNAIDPTISSIVQNDVSCAVDRLQYCVTKTEEAANTTMEIAEKHLASMKELEENIQKLHGPQDAVRYLENFKKSYEKDLTEIITAQSFQDLTGQTLQKVIQLVAEIEKELVGIVTTFGLKLEIADEKEIHEKVNQSDVDELLKEFGF
jgi:chemotaxis protein CheZ